MVFILWIVSLAANAGLLWLNWHYLHPLGEWYEKSALIAQACFIFVSLGDVDITERAGVLLFGWPFFEIGPGKYLGLWGILSFRKVPKSIVSLIFPDPAKVSFDHKKANVVAAGKEMPIRTTHLGILDTRDPLEVSMTTEPEVQMRFIIKEGEVLAFLSAFGSIKKFYTQMRGVIETRLNIECPLKTLRAIMMNQLLLNLRLKEEVQKTIDNTSGGIVKAMRILTLLDVSVTSFDKGHALNLSLRKMGEGVGAANVIHSEGKAKNEVELERLEYIAKGNRAQLMAEVDAEEASAKRVMNTKGGRRAAELGTITKIAGEIYKNAQVAVVSNDLGSSLTGASAALGILGKLEGKLTPPDKVHKEGGDGHGHDKTKDGKGDGKHKKKTDKDKKGGGGGPGEHAAPKPGDATAKPDEKAHGAADPGHGTPPTGH
ncbi:MAG: hypothetical protein PHV93_01725 [Candidatus Pacebacteria bacterium]|nr:hypothetical protein [Candidatus Paceibacterota bacterium]